jgi:hypothetical protein
MEAVQMICRCGHKKHLWATLTVKITVENGFVQLNNQATPWRGIFMDAHLPIKKHQNGCMMIAKTADARPKHLPRPTW